MSRKRCQRSGVASPGVCTIARIAEIRAVTSPLVTPGPTVPADTARAVSSAIASLIRRAVGDAVPHLHVHLLPRFPGTPREYWWTKVDEWPEARRGDAAQIGDLVRELSAFIASGRDGKGQ